MSLSRTRTTCWALTLTLGLPLCAEASVRQPESRSDTLRALMRAAEIPGLAIARVREGSVEWVDVYGVKRADSPEPVIGETVFEAASLSKPVFAYAVLRLAERGELDLDRPLWDLLPYPRLEHDRRARRITPRMVLTHMSGLPNWGGTPLELSHDPGARWSYSGEGFVFLQRALEEGTGLTLNELVRREVFEPLGMERSSYVWRPAYDTLAATGHDLIGELREKRKPSEGNAAASLHTTAGEYARFLAAVLDGEGLGEATGREMLTGRAAVRGFAAGEPVDGLEWGLGWGIQYGDRGKAIWHWGDNGFFRCFVIGYPESGDGLVYFTNSQNGLAIAEEVLSAFFPDTHHAVDYLDYDRYDDPARLARIELRRAFLVGTDSGLAVYDRWSSTEADVLSGEIGDLVDFLLGRDRAKAAIAVARAGVRSRPESPDAHIHLGVAYTGDRHYPEALRAYQRAQALGPENPENLSARIDWLRTGLEAKDRTVELNEKMLRRYAGDYGPRHVSLRDGELYYHRDGSTSKTRLVPLTEQVFALESVPTFRLRFEFGESGAVEKIVGLYADGRTDESPRTN